MSQNSNPIEIEKEISILYTLGIDDSEVEYLLNVRKINCNIYDADVTFF